MPFLKTLVSLPYVIATSLVLMFAYGFVRMYLILPINKEFLQTYINLLHYYRWWLNPIIYGYLLIFPLLVLGLWWRQRAADRGAFSRAEGAGLITVSEQFIRKFIRSVCAEIPGIVDMQVVTQRAGAGVAVRILVKIDVPESWVPVKNELLRRIPEQTEKIIGENMIASLEIVCQDLAGRPRELRIAGESRSLQPGALEPPQTWAPPDVSTGEYSSGWDMRNENDKPR
ncbi:MAG: hypothetical protein NTX50_32145 [Candidatus Sumerlaeota bacterium]|nr:hypothetical protein [Candidatus Sumerlaeota bacterium]